MLNSVSSENSPSVTETTTLKSPLKFNGGVTVKILSIIITSALSHVALKVRGSISISCASIWTSKIESSDISWSIIFNISGASFDGWTKINTVDTSENKSPSNTL